MFVIIVIGVVLVSVLGGFLLEGGNSLVLMHWLEFIIILGSATGALVVATPKTTLVKMVQYVLGSFKSTGVSKESFQELLLLLYETFQTARVKGLLTLEQHVEKPEESELFSKYPVILKSHHTLEYLVDSLKLMVVGGVPPLEQEALLDSDLETQEEEGKKPAHALAARPTPCRAWTLWRRYWVSFSPCRPSAARPRRWDIRWAQPWWASFWEGSCVTASCRP